jgi:hypothetical protein
MQHEAACPQDEYLWAIEVARAILPPDIHLQAPPNLSDDFAVLLDAGIDDWGGVSPVTADQVNPERPWPALDKLRVASETRGKVLAPRLTIYPEFVHAPNTWLASTLHFPVLDRSDAEGLGRDDPGQVWPEKVTAADVVLDGAEVVLVGHRSTQWYSGANNPTPTLITNEHNDTVTGRVAEILRGVELGHRINEQEIVDLFAARGPEVRAIARERVGAVKPGRVVEPKTARKKPKHKKAVEEEKKRKANEEAKAKKEEAERKKKEAEDKKREDIEKKKAEDAERKKETEEKKKEEAERKKKELDDKKAAEEEKKKKAADDKKRADDEKKAKLEEEKKGKDTTK